MKFLDFEYATFRPDIQKYIKSKVLTKPTTILDPMAGTAPLIPFFETHGHKAYLYDILPIHYHINKVKRLNILESFYKYGSDWFEQTLFKHMAPLDEKRSYISEKWIEDTILVDFVNAWNLADEHGEKIATLLKAIIILSIKPFSSFTKTGNPTWIRPGGITSDKSIHSIVHEKIELIKKYYNSSYPDLNKYKKGECIFGIGDASGLQINDEINIILTSPPYCNRFDYMKRYSPELFFLSHVGFPISYDRLIGTNAVKDYNNYEEDINNIGEISSYTFRLLTRIEEKGKSTENNYYIRYYTRYFTSLFKTFHNLSQILSKNGRIYIVIQDNMHRGELIEIDKALKQFFNTNGFKTKILKKWERHHLGRRNVSKDYKVIFIRQFEKLMVVYR